MRFLDTAQVTKVRSSTTSRDREDLGFRGADWHVNQTPATARRDRAGVCRLPRRPIPCSGSFGDWTPSRKWPAAGRVARGLHHRNMSTALSDCHDGFRKRLAECFDEMAQDFLPHLEAAARQKRMTRRTDAVRVARYSSRSSKGRSCRPVPSATRSCSPAVRLVERALTKNLDS